MAGFDEIPDFLRQAVEDSLKEAGIPEGYLSEFMDNPSSCEFGENGEHVERFWDTFSGVLRVLFLGGAFQRAIQYAMSYVASNELPLMLASEPLTQNEWDAYTHIQMHVGRLMFDSIARDAIEPWVLAMYQQGKYVANDNGPDFLCVEAAVAAKREADGDN